jgi:predicted aspartyl protease
LLPRKIAEKIKPTEIGEGEFILADGSRVKRVVYKVEIELEDSKGKRKKCEAHATIEEREEPAVSFEVLEKLGAVINIRKKEIIFEE